MSVRRSVSGKSKNWKLGLRSCESTSTSGPSPETSSPERGCNSSSPRPKDSVGTIRPRVPVRYHRDTAANTHTPSKLQAMVRQCPRIRRPRISRPKLQHRPVHVQRRPVQQGRPRRTERRWMTKVNFLEIHRPGLGLPRRHPTTHRRWLMNRHQSRRRPRLRPSPDRSTTSYLSKPKSGVSILLAEVFTSPNASWKLTPRSRH